MPTSPYGYQPVAGLDGGPIPVSGEGLFAGPSATFTRPNDTTTYAAFDSISNSTSSPTAMTFAASARAAGGSGLILSARHIKNSATTANATFRLHLYRDTIAAVNDNAQYPLLWANRANRIGHIDFSHTTMGTGSDSSSSLVTYVGLPFIAAGTALYGRLIALAAYTPAAQEQHFIELQIAQN